VPASSNCSTAASVVVHGQRRMGKTSHCTWTSAKYHRPPLGWAEIALASDILTFYNIAEMEGQRAAAAYSAHLKP
jgi:hypothetical protein